MAKCAVCGAPMEKESCGYCGYTEGPQSQQMPTEINGTPRQVVYTQVINQSVNQPANPGIVPGVSKKKRMTALFLCIFLGEFGIHRFYVGKIGTGLLYLFTLGLFGVGWLIDIILIAAGAFRDEFYLPLKD